MPDSRLNILSAKSPKTEIATVATESTTKPLIARLPNKVSPEKWIKTNANIAAVIMPPNTPCHVFPGDTFGASLCLPKARPAK